MQTQKIAITPGIKKRTSVDLYYGFLTKIYLKWKEATKNA